MENSVAVSIICNTYNHRKYIRRAIEGFLSQKTTFNYEILIHDDASNDGTREIIKEYEEKYPDIVKPIYQTDNKWEKGIDITYAYQYPRAKGKYIAICEGDDYWTDSNKLQKQYEVMENSSHIDMCSHKAIIVFGDTENNVGFLGPCESNVILSAKQVIEGGGGYLATNSLFFRKAIIEEKDKFIEVFDIDYALQMKGALRGGIYYFGDCMSAYRRMSEGSWTTLMNNDLARKSNFYKREVKMLRQFNIDTGRQFQKSVYKVITINYFKSIVFKLLSIGEKTNK